ncbi:MAG: hypothetical protein HZA90_14470 [Verrucomicrobia bacterium]|nr:hypothetical protein [Verrucomicrobiota bacterium]
MNWYPNLPPEQRRLQGIVDRFNADARLWEKLAENRRRRRKRFPFLSEKTHKKLDLLEHAKARPPQDCVGELMAP